MARQLKIAPRRSVALFRFLAIMVALSYLTVLALAAACACLLFLLLAGAERMQFQLLALLVGGVAIAAAKLWSLVPRGEKFDSPGAAQSCGGMMHPRLVRSWRVPLGLLILSAPCGVRSSAQQQPVPPTDSELQATSERGRALAAYDQAVWHATDAVQMANPKTAQDQHRLAHFENERWTVVFGYLNPDKTKFLITYQATQGNKPQLFIVRPDDPPNEEAGFYLFAARALETALADFGQSARPYNTAVLPAHDGQLYVYLYPAQLQAGIYPLGGDVRYLISADGQKILKKRQLHKTILESVPAAGKKARGFHTHVSSDAPEDTDVLHVLQQDPRLPELVTTTHFVYEITTDGSIRIKQEKKK